MYVYITMFYHLKKQQFLSFNMQSVTGKNDTVVNVNSWYPRLLNFI